MAFAELLRKKEDARTALCQRFAALVKQRLPGAELRETGPMQFLVNGPGLQESTLLLENLFRQIEGLDPDETDAVVHQHVHSLVGVSKPVHAMVRREQIVPMIKDQAYLDLFGNEDLAVEHLTADLWIVYAVDLPTSMRTLRPEQVEALGLSAGELRTLAVGNLLALLPPMETHADEEWMLVTAGSDYTASLLLLDGVWEQLAEEVKGDLVVAAPTRDVLLVTGSGSAAGIAAVRAKAIELEQGGSYAISQTLLRRRYNRWVALG